MPENETVEFALCFECHKHGNFVLQPDGMWQCPNCHSLREIATKTEADGLANSSKTEAGDLTNPSDSTRILIMNKVVFVQAYCLSRPEVLKSNGKVNTERLTKDLQEAVELLNKEGYEVVNVTQVISGNYDWSYKETGFNGNAGGYGYGYGYSFTSGLMVVARKV